MDLVVNVSFEIIMKGTQILNRTRSSISQNKLKRYRQSAGFDGNGRTLGSISHMIECMLERVFACKCILRRTGRCAHGLDKFGMDLTLEMNFDFTVNCFGCNIIQGYLAFDRIASVIDCLQTIE